MPSFAPLRAQSTHSLPDRLDLDPAGLTDMDKTAISTSGTVYRPQRSPSLHRHRNRRTLRRGLGTLLTLAAILSWTLVSYTIRSDATHSSNNNPLSHSPELSTHLPCHDFASGANETLLILRTGSTELENRLPAHLSTTLRCHPNHLIFSDREHHYGGEHIIDALATVSENIKSHHKDFEIYRQFQRKGVTEDLIRQAPGIQSGLADGDAFGHTENPAWKLDKWKFLPMLERTFQDYPDMKWYVFIEDDTHLFSSSLYQYLSVLDHTQPLYIGQRFRIGQDWFAQGGSGFIMSRRAMHLTVEHYASRQDEIETFVDHHWAGDCVLGKFAAEAGSPLRDVYPHLVKDYPGVSMFSAREWCAPVITYHHITQEMSKALWRFEQLFLSQRSPDSGDVIRHRDVFDFWVKPRLSRHKTAWDNLSNLEQDAPDAQACQAHCRADTHCSQWSFAVGSGKCKLGVQPRLGIAAEGVTSGWLADRVDAYEKRMPICKESVWVLDRPQKGPDETVPLP